MQRIARLHHTTSFTSTPSPSISSLRVWAAAWEEYVRGHVVSKTAADLIQSFLLKTMAVGGKSNDSDESEADQPEDDPDVPALRLSRSALLDLIAPNFAKLDSKNAAAGSEPASTGTKLKASVKKQMKEGNYERSIAIGQAVWSTPDIEVKAEDRGNPGHMFEDSFQDHIAALSTASAKADKFTAPFDPERNAAANWNQPNAGNDLDATMDRIMTAQDRPNREQEAFLRHFSRRLKLIVLEMQQGRINSTAEEPLLDLIHGFPGTGKSAVPTKCGWRMTLFTIYQDMCG